MATADDTYSPRLEEFGRRQKQAREAAEDVKAEFIEGMVSSRQTRQEPEPDPSDTETAEFDLLDAAYDGARKVLRAPRVAEREAAAQRMKSREERSKELQAERAEPEAKPASSLVDLSPSVFKAALTAAFKNLDVDQAAWLKNIAEQAERNAWERESEGEADGYIEDPEKHFKDQLSDSDERDEYGNLKSEYYPDDVPEVGDG